MDDAVRRAPSFEAESEAYTLFSRGLAFLNERHPGQAAMLLSRALRLEPGRNSIREALGRAEFALGRYQRALEVFEAIAEHVPDNDYARYALGRCCIALGREAEARAHLRVALALKPACRLYRDALEAIA